MTQKERLGKTEECNRFDNCSASVCGLDPSGRGSYVSGDKFCPLILDYLEGKEFPLKEAVKANEHLWRKHLSDKLITAKLAARKKLGVLDRQEYSKNERNQNIEKGNRFW